MITYIIPTIGTVSLEQIKGSLDSAWRTSAEVVREIVVIDNQSPPSFSRGLQSIVATHVNTRVVRTAERMSMAHNWNFGLAQVRTPWFILLHDDDRVAQVPKKLPEVSSEKCSFIIGDAVIVRGRLRIHSAPANLPGYPGRNGIFYKVPKLCATVLSTQIWKKTGGWREEHGMFLDYAAFLMANHAAPCVANKALLQGEYVLHGNNTVLLDRNRRYGDAIPATIKDLYELYTDKKERGWIIKHMTDFCYGRTSFDHRVSKLATKCLMGFSL